MFGTADMEVELDSSGVTAGSCPAAAAAALDAIFAVNSLEAAVEAADMVVEVALVLALDALDSLLELGLATRGQDDIYRES
jgi:hypothetical protein